MKVLHVMAGARVGGAEAYFERLVPALQRRGMIQRAAIRRHAARAERLEASGIEVLQLRFGGRLDYATGRALGREVAAFSPDLVVSWMSRAASLCPKLAVPHVGRLGGYYDLKYYRACDHLIGNTRDLVRHIVEQGWPAERAHHLPNFVDATSQPPVPRAELATPAGAPLLLALGRLHVNKGFDVLLEALAALPAACLWLAGEGPEQARLTKLVETLGLNERVRFLGWRRDVPALLAACDLLVCPSRHEPLGNVVLEGWAQGRPVIAAAAQGPSALISTGESGLLVPRDDAAALAEAIGRVLGDRDFASRLAAGGRAAYEADFTEAKVVARTLELFARIAGGSGAGGEARCDGL